MFPLAAQRRPAVGSEGPRRHSATDPPSADRPHGAGHGETAALFVPTQSLITKKQKPPGKQKKKKVGVDLLFLLLFLSIFLFSTTTQRGEKEPSSKFGE